MDVLGQITWEKQPTTVDQTLEYVWESIPSQDWDKWLIWKGWNIRLLIISSLHLLIALKLLLFLKKPLILTKAAIFYNNNTF